MTTSSWLINATQKLTLSYVRTARLDAEIMLAGLFGKDRAWIHAHPEHILQRSVLRKLDDMVARRVDGEPVAYITGYKEFYGRDFVVNKDVLVPRPESESFIELLRPLASVRPPQGIYNVLDMGTGSGCLAITVKLEFPHLSVFATDTSKPAITTAIKNSRNHNVSIQFKVQSLLLGDKQGYDIIIANLPYVPDDMRDPSIAHEPEIALFSGTDGLSHYRQLFEQLEPKHIRYIMCESLVVQHKSVEKLASVAGYNLTETNGLVQLFEKRK
jgi:release factor glutamine methyltransferase